MLSAPQWPWTMDGMTSDATTEPLPLIPGGLLDSFRKASEAHGWDPAANLRMEAEGDGGGEGGDEGAGDEGSSDEGAGETKVEKVELTQAELDDLIAKRVAKATKAAQDEAKTKADREKMDEVERLKAEAADREKADEAKTKTANQRIVRTEAKVAAIAAGVKASDVDEFLPLVKLDGIEVDDDGAVDAKALKKAVEAVLAKPAYKTAFTDTGTGGASGGDHTGGHASSDKPKNLQEAIDQRLAKAG